MSISPDESPLSSAEHISHSMHEFAGQIFSQKKRNAEVSSFPALSIASTCCEETSRKNSCVFLVQLIPLKKKVT